MVSIFSMATNIGPVYPEEFTGGQTILYRFQCGVNGIELLRGYATLHNRAWTLQRGYHPV